MQVFQTNITESTGTCEDISQANQYAYVVGIGQSTACQKAQYDRAHHLPVVNNSFRNYYVTPQGIPVLSSNALADRSPNHFVPASIPYASPLHGSSSDLSSAHVWTAQQIGPGNRMMPSNVYTDPVNPHAKNYPADYDARPYEQLVHSPQTEEAAGFPLFQENDSFIQKIYQHSSKSSIEDERSSISSDLNPNAKAFVFAPGNSSSSSSSNENTEDSSKNFQLRRLSINETTAEGLRRRRHSLDSLDFNAISVQDVPSFMRALRLHKYTDTLTDAGIDFPKLLHMNEQELEAVGVTTQGARRRLLLAVQKYCDFMSQQVNKSAFIAGKLPDLKTILSISTPSGNSNPNCNIFSDERNCGEGPVSSSSSQWCRNSQFYCHTKSLPPRRNRLLVSISEKSDEDSSACEECAPGLLGKVKASSNNAASGCVSLSEPLGTVDEINELEESLKQQEERLIDWIEADDENHKSVGHS